MNTRPVLIASLGFLVIVCWMSLPAPAQDESGRTTINGLIAGDGTGTLIFEARGKLPEPPVFFTATARSTAKVGTDRIEQVVQLNAEVIQGTAKTLSFGFSGDGEITEVKAKNLRSWSVRLQDSERFLDLHLVEGTVDLKAVLKIRSTKLQLPTVVDLAHLSSGDAVGFDSIVNVNFAADVAGTVIDARGFSPLEPEEQTIRFQSATGGLIKLSLDREGASPGRVELVDTTLKGELHPNGKSVQFEFRSTAHVREPNTAIDLLSGNAAISEVPTDANYRVRLTTTNDQPTYQLVFTESGTFPIEISFVASLGASASEGKSMDFIIAASAIVPLELNGLGTDLAFDGDQASVVPVLTADTWSGFLPATGRAKLHWKAARQAGEGKLFFTTTAQVEVKVGAGLMQQEHRIDYKVLQGELKSLSIQLHGPGEVLDVQGNNLVGWKVSGEDEKRRLDISLSQAVVNESQVIVRSQMPLEAFPVRVEAMRLNPIGAIRHSGFLRLTNLASVRLEPIELSGLTQLSPDQFPGPAIEARQVFVYRFPAAENSFSVAADRIQPEINVAELVLYELAETDRVIRGDIELDIREAPIREWDFVVPSDYSVVSVTGASVADYISASEEVDGRRNLKVVFNQDVIGRQLVTLQLEKSEAAAAGDWELPRIEYPDAKTVRGDIGIIGAPGFRITVGTTELLVEKPLSYFPKPSAHLQQAFRIREPNWTATMHIEMLNRSIQSDVFHLYSLSDETVYGSALINYFVTGSPVSQWRIAAPATLGNVLVDGQDVRTWRREGDELIVSLHQPVMGAYTLLVTFEEKTSENLGSFRAGQITPLEVQGERGYIQVVSPTQVEITTESISEEILKLDPLELPAEFRLLSTAPPLGTWQYTERPFDMNLKVTWFQPGTMVAQVVEFSEANSRVSQDGELVTEVVYFVKSRGQRTMKVQLPGEPVRLWEVSVNGKPVTARQTDDATLIPLPGGTDPNIPIEVSLRLGKPAVDPSHPELMLPIVFAPVLKTLWNVVGDENYALLPSGGTVTPPIPVRRPTGFEWVAKRGIVFLTLISLFTSSGFWLTSPTNQRPVRMTLGLVSLIIAVCMCFLAAMMAFSQTGPPSPLQLSLPILSTGETIQLQVANTPLWRVNLSWIGLASMFVGCVAIAWSLKKASERLVMPLRCGGIVLIALGVLLQGDSAPWFFLLLAVAILIALLIPRFTQSFRRLVEFNKRDKVRDTTVAPGPAVPSIIALAFTICLANSGMAAVPDGFQSADLIEQQWQVTHQNAHLAASGTVQLSGRAGDQFILLRAPAVLTRFESNELRLTKIEIADEGLAYIISIPVGDDREPLAEDAKSGPLTKTHRATFEYQLESIRPSDGIPVLTGTASVQRVHVSYDEPGWEVHCPTAIRIEAADEPDATKASVLLGLGRATLFLRPHARDVTNEKTQFFVETSNLYLPGPGVVDGRHRLHIRVSQGRVADLDVLVPNGLTVSAVTGPVGSWQFDADSGGLKLEIEPAQSQAFDVIVETQRGLDPLPAEVSLAPLQVTRADGEVGLMAVAFGPDAQPEKSQPDRLSAVNLSDFDTSLLPNSQAVLHRVYRYGSEGGRLSLRVAPVDPEVRVSSNQILSLGDERIVLGINASVDITRAGLFQLSFVLPDGLEVESLTGPALHHWTELTEGDSRQIILHLNGKTIGSQSFAVTLSGLAPINTGEWKIPRFILNEAARQSGELIVRPTTGIRLRTVSRQNVSETDPRTMGGEAQGSLAFRLLQKDWDLVLGIEKLDPWITGRVLHDVTLREGQTRSTIVANFDVQNASIRTLQVVLPLTDQDEIKTLRASGSTVSDFVRVNADSSVWEIQFKRRVVGKVDFRIEYERRGDRENDNEALMPADFPQARQLAYYYAVRAGGRLELEHNLLTDGWQQLDWSMVPAHLREAENRIAPMFALRATAPQIPLVVHAKRHSLADALKLRVADGSLTTVLSPNGDQLTAVEVTIEVIQRSSLNVGLPEGGELFSIFVNGESVNSIRQAGNTNAWQFYILPGIDDRTAKVRFVYSVTGDQLRHLKLTSPELNVPLENIQWNVIAPKGFELTDSDGNLELTRQTHQATYDRDSYLSKASGRRQIQAQQAAQLLEQANQFLQAGDQTKARWALNSVANQYALDAASNEDARVQLENLQTQQAIVGLNTRRQRLYLDNNPDDVTLAENQQLREAAVDNPILQQDQLNFRPQQLSELLGGNTTEDNANLEQLACRLVQHQRTAELAPQAIIIGLPEEGLMYTFSRSVQVAENAPLELELEFELQRRVHLWQTGLAIASLLALAGIFAFVPTRWPRQLAD